MTDNTDAVEKLEDILEKNMEAKPWDSSQADLKGIERTAKAILAAIQADPLAYVKVRPLVWHGFVSGAYRIEVLDGGIANLWFHDAREVEAGEPELLMGGYLTLVSIDDLKSAAYDDLCKRVAQLFEGGDA